MASSDEKPKALYGADYAEILRGAAKQMMVEGEASAQQREHEKPPMLQARPEVFVLVRDHGLTKTMEPIEELVLGCIPKVNLVVRERDASFLLPEFRFQLARQMVIHGIVDRDVGAHTAPAKLTQQQREEAARGAFDAAKERVAGIDIRVVDTVRPRRSQAVS